MKSLADIDDRRLADALRARGGRVTPQRLVMAAALRRGARHVTAEGLQDELRGRLPGLSLPTVYATLALFEEMGLVRRVSVPGEATAYDTRPEPHGHLVCRRCGSVSDLDQPLAPAHALAAARATGFRAERAEIVVTGVCASCAERTGAPQGPGAQGPESTSATIAPAVTTTPRASS